MADSEKFRIGLSADFLDADRQLVFPDLGLSLLDEDPRVSYEFMAEYKPEYAPGATCRLRCRDLAQNRLLPPLLW